MRVKIGAKEGKAMTYEVLKSLGTLSVKPDGSRREVGTYRGTTGPPSSI
jgi:hypothetical protein